ncbi:MAG: hypothetical protein NUW23_02225 [Firmicutes bacterium]|jgi:Cd2+/Zn2+-exporting ATPase|nr:hypothetical protein [Bacillota bacterium]
MTYRNAHVLPRTNAATSIAVMPVAPEAWVRPGMKQFSISLLVTLAAVGAVMIGEYREAAIVTFLYALGGRLEGAVCSSRGESVSRGSAS